MMLSSDSESADDGKQDISLNSRTKAFQNTSMCEIPFLGTKYLSVIPDNTSRDFLLQDKISQDKIFNTVPQKHLDEIPEKAMNGKQLSTQEGIVRSKNIVLVDPPFIKSK